MHHDQLTLAMLKNAMSDLGYSNNKPKKGGCEHSTAFKNIDSWVKDTTSEDADLSVHKLMNFSQGYSIDNEQMNPHFLQKCRLEQFLDNMEAKEIKSDLKTIKACLQKIRDATSDTTKIVLCTIQVKKKRAAKS